MKINMSRDVTTRVHWVLDNILPPVVRDCKPVMKVLAWLIYGKYGKYYLNFKEDGKFLEMGDEEIRDYYVMIEPIITRKTDINRSCLKVLFQKVKLFEGAGTKVLDISCGRGYLATALAKRFPTLSVTGCDINIPDKMRKNIPGNLTYVEGNIEKLCFQDHEFDIVICAHTLEHVVHADQALEELRRVCKRKLIIIVPCQREYQYTMDFHVQFFPYPYSLQKFTGNMNSICKKIDRDLYYEEDMGIRK